MRWCILTICILFLKVSPAQALEIDLRGPGWSHVKGKHFSVFYSSMDNDDDARNILRKAEEYYSAVADRIGYSRYKNFWTWDDRVQVIYFKDQATFAAEMGQPPWAKAFSFSHTGKYNLRLIVSFKGQDNFLDSILPHEIGHLVLHDLMGGRNPPLWFDEGVAQLNEQRLDDEYKPIVAKLALAGQTVPFDQLDGYRLKGKTDAREVSIFYAETLYIVDFLIKTYGNEAFRKLCRHMRDGDTFEDALKAAYYPTLDSLAVFEEKWKSDMGQLIR